ncbi:MAG: VWA domain-containing protein, partial [Chloroflexi bacterium]
MRRTFLFLAALTFLLSFSLTPPIGTAQGGPTVEIGGVDTEQFPQLTVLVTTRDQYNVPVQNLTTADFQVTVDGNPVEVVSVENITQSELPISVVLVIDTSESMVGEPLNDAKEAALAFLDNLAPGDEVALIDFDSVVRVVQDFTTDLDAVRASIEALEAGGRTALYDASAAAAELANRANTPRRFVVLLTDGNEYGGLSANPRETGVTLG